MRARTLAWVASVLVLGGCLDGEDQGALDTRPAPTSPQADKVSAERTLDREYPGDARAKAQIRDLVAGMEECYRHTAHYIQCVEETLGRRPPDSGDGPGQVMPLSVTHDEFSVRAVSHEETDGEHHTFTAARDAEGRELRTCKAGQSDDAGACLHGAWGFALPARPRNSGVDVRRRLERGHDAEAKSRAVRVASAMKRCGSRTGDYLRCTDPRALGLAPSAIGAMAGQAEVAGIDGEEFTVISHSLTGINFTLEVRGGDTARFCSPAGTGACPADGNW